MKLAIILGSSRSDGFSSKLLECIQSEFENIASNHHMRFSASDHEILDRVISKLEAEIND